jgi:hypothetical protein
MATSIKGTTLLLSKLKIAKNVFIDDILATNDNGSSVAHAQNQTHLE